MWLTAVLLSCNIQFLCLYSQNKTNSFNHVFFPLPGSTFSRHVQFLLKGGRLCQLLCNGKKLFCLSSICSVTQLLCLFLFSSMFVMAIVHTAVCLSFLNVCSVLSYQRHKRIIIENLSPCSRASCQPFKLNKVTAQFLITMYLK